MALRELKKMDTNLNKIYANQITTNTNNENFIDRSDILFEQMRFIALNNKSFFKF